MWKYLKFSCKIDLLCILNCKRFLVAHNVLLTQKQNEYTELASPITETI